MNLISRSFPRVAPVALAAILAGGCGPSDASGVRAADDRAEAFDLDAVRAVVEEKNRQFTQAHITGDSTVLIHYFTQDAHVLPPHSEPVVGRPAIAALNAAYVASGIHEFREETTSFYGNDAYVIDEGTYYMRYGEDSTVETGKYLNVWTLEDGEWRVRANIWNTNAPPAPED